MSGKKITTIVFDIGGVLLDIHPEKTYQYISDSTDIEIDVVKNRFPWDAHDEYEKGNPCAPCYMIFDSNFRKNRPCGPLVH